MSTEPQLPVLIVGAGPVGLTLACEQAWFPYTVRSNDKGDLIDDPEP